MRDGLVAVGYTQVQLSQDAAVDGQDWTDWRTPDAWGADDFDPFGTDWADVAFFAGHGLAVCGDDVAYSSISMGDWRYDPAINMPPLCDPQTDLHMRFGNGGENEEAKVVLLHACQSAHYCVWQGGGYNTVRAGASFNTFNGFHGISYSSSSSPSQFKNYITGAKYNGIGLQWIQRFTDIAYFSGHDQCATSMIYAATGTEADNQFTNGGFRDQKTTTMTTGQPYYYYTCGCNPDGGVTLPDC